MKARQAENEKDYESFKGPKKESQRLDLRDLLKRLEEQKKDDKKLNTLILAGVAAVAFVVLLILSL